MPITGSVGKGGTNQAADVQQVEEHLARHRRWLAPMQALVPDGVCDAATIDSILKFQLTAAALEESRCDGLVSAKGYTIRRLEMGEIPYPKHAAFSDQTWTRNDSITADEFEAAAKRIGCEVEVIKAIAMQETADRGAWDDVRGRPTILFERHKFSLYSKSVWDKTHPDISNPTAGGWGFYRQQYPKLQRAAILDETAALLSASWGLFQLMGFNYAACGYDSVDAFVTGMLESQSKHLDAAVNFTLANATLKDAFVKRLWKTLAKNYNGANYAKNNYDKKIEGYYDQLIAAKKAAAAPKKPGAK